MKIPHDIGSFWQEAVGRCARTRESRHVRSEKVQRLIFPTAWDVGGRLQGLRSGGGPVFLRFAIDGAAQWLA